MKKKLVFPLFLVLFVAFFLRFTLINFGLPSKNLALTTYNPDEPLSYYTMEKWNPQKLDFHPRRTFLWGGFHLYPLATSLGIAKIIGYLRFGEREFYTKNLAEADKLYLVGRFLTILFAVGSVLLIFLILKESYNETVGLLGALLFAIAPVHVINSIYVRPDIMMLFFCLLALYFSLKLLKTCKIKYYFLSCLSIGLATGAKLSGAVYGIVPIITHFLIPLPFSMKKSEEKLHTSLEKVVKYVYDIKLYLIPLICLLSFCLSSPYVILDFNRTSESFLSYLIYNFNLAKGAMDLGQLYLLGFGPISYFRHYLRYGLGSFIVIMSVIGIILMTINMLKTKNKFDILFLISGLIILFVISSTKNQTVWYTIPVIPFFIIYTVRGLNIIYWLKFPLFRKISVILVILTFCYTFVYSIAYWKLYKEKNVRKEASEWIEKSIPKGTKIAIARSYFWTPPVLRQYNPPYKVLMGGDPIHSSVSEAVLGLEKILFEAEYIVLTEYEYRWAIHPKLKKHFSKHFEIINKIFSEQEFKKVAEFDKQAKFLFLIFKKNYPSIDWLIPNPRIIIFKRIEKAN